MERHSWQIHIEGRTHAVEARNGTLRVDGRPWKGTVERLPDGRWKITDEEGQVLLAARKSNGGWEMVSGPFSAEVTVRSPLDQLRDTLRPKGKSRAASATLKAAMPGLVLKVMAEEGRAVEKGTPLLVLEAMKMENIIKAEGPGVVKTIHVTPGQAVEKGQPLISFGE